MKKRFVVCVNSATNEQNKQFKEFIRENGLGWWHWLRNVWLLSDSKGKFSAAEIRDQLGRNYPGVYSLVLELRGDDDTWSGFGPKKEGKNMFKWIRDNW
jgi:hypothetical protein